MASVGGTPINPETGQPYTEEDFARIAAARAAQMNPGATRGSETDPELAAANAAVPRNENGHAEGYWARDPNNPTGGPETWIFYPNRWAGMPSNLSPASLSQYDPRTVPGNPLYDPNFRGGIYGNYTLNEDVRGVVGNAKDEFEGKNAGAFSWSEDEAIGPGAVNIPKGAFADAAGTGGGAPVTWIPQVEARNPYAVPAGTMQGLDMTQPTAAEQFNTNYGSSFMQPSYSAGYYNALMGGGQPQPQQQQQPAQGTGGGEMAATNFASAKMAPEKAQAPTYSPTAQPATGGAQYGTGAYRGRTAAAAAPAAQAAPQPINSALKQTNFSTVSQQVKPPNPTVSDAPARAAVASGNIYPAQGAPVYQQQQPTQYLSNNRLDANTASAGYYGQNQSRYTNSPVSGAVNSALNNMGTGGFGEAFSKQAVSDYYGRTPELSDYTAQNYEQLSREMPNIASEPGFGAYYDRAKERTAQSLNNQMASRGAYGSSVALGQLGDAFVGLDAERANREADYNLARLGEQRGWAGLRSEAASSADLASARASGEERDWLMGLGNLALSGDELRNSRNRDFANTALAYGDQDISRLKAGFDAAQGVDAADLARVMGGGTLAHYASQDDLARQRLGLDTAVAATDAQRQRGRDYVDDNFRYGDAVSGVMGANYGDMFAGDERLVDSQIAAALGLTAEQLSGERWKSEQGKADRSQRIDEAADIAAIAKMFETQPQPRYRV